MRYCATCLQPDTRPNTVFDERGVCPACNYARSLDAVDWEERFEQLTEYLAARPKKAKRSFDCIIGVSGGKDSTRQALWVRDKLKLRPLLVCLSFPPQQVSKNGVMNISNLINLGFDVVVSAPAPETWRLLMRESFFKFTNWARSSELALFSSVPQAAIRYGIPIVFWGENPALQVGDLKTSGSAGWDGNNLRYSNTLSSGHQWMRDLGYEPNELIPYIYPEHAEFNASDIQIIFLGWYLKNWSLFENAGISSTYGLSLRDDLPENTGDLNGTSNLDEDWHLMNQMIKYYKFGFGKVTEIVSEEIRYGRMSRERAIELVERYDGACSARYIETFCEYIGVSVVQFWDQVRAAANQKLFNVDADGAIRRRFKVGMGL
ncbi:MAG: N-acetyl sugar amidotransferase [Deltaproteobacteria bacterium]|nr:N-acetyl sugar amidotransferase [Deltaproteobacteria bacterium]